MSDHPAFRCPQCFALGDDDPMPAWRILRSGDVAVSRAWEKWRGQFDFAGEAGQ